MDGVGGYFGHLIAHHAGNVVFATVHLNAAAAIEQLTRLHVVVVAVYLKLRAQIVGQMREAVGQRFELLN